jgi:endonuclease-3|tara:strand:+ start:968 stop:1636 length:669 start_codon:yes stop_codon:yes gene_type:complete
MLSITILLKKMEKMVKIYSNDELTALGEISSKTNSDPFRILISTILSHRTRDVNTSKASKNLFSVINSPQDLNELDLELLVDLIKPVAFYNVKARRLKQVSVELITEFNGIVPDNIDDLLSLTSVGRKTANCVLVYGFGLPAIPVDTHVHRISNRLNLVSTTDPDDTEFELNNVIPKKYWLNVNELFVRFGQTVCAPIKPNCNVCSLTNNCSFYKKISQSKN